MPRAVIVSASESRALFPSLRRLHVPSEYSAVAAARRVLKGQSFDLHLLLRDDRSFSRLGMIVPKRLARAAVLRNSIKRQAREAFRLARLERGADLVLRLKRSLAGTADPDKIRLRKLRAEIEALFARFSTEA